MIGPHIALIGFGEVGVTLAEALAGRAAITAWDVKFDDPVSGPSLAAASRRVRRAKGPRDAVAGAGLVISAVTAARTVDVAQDCSPAIGRDAFFLDLNSASPRAKREAASLINNVGGRYVEAAVMTPIQPRRLTAPLLLGGPHARSFLVAAGALGFTSVHAVSQEYGVAAATKLCRSIVVKGLEALLTESMLAARHYGVDAAVLASLDDFFPGVVWPELTRYMLSRAIVHGARRAEEMHEAARMVADASFEPLLCNAIAARQKWSANLEDPSAERNLRDYLDAVRGQLKSKETATDLADGT